jgi:hypothetical protein
VSCSCSLIWISINKHRSALLVSVRMVDGREVFGLDEVGSSRVVLFS